MPVGAATSIAAPVPNGVYHLSVLATNANGPGVESAGITLTVPAAAAAPGSPSGLSASVGGNAATFTWSAPGGGGPVSNYVLLAGATPGFASPIASLPVAGTTVAVGGIPVGVYYVRVVAQGPGGASAPTNEVTVTIAGAAAPGAPALNAPSVTAGRTVNLSWSAGAGGAPVSFTLIATATPGGAPIVVVPLGGNSVSFPGVPAGTYYLRLTASNAAGTSAPSNQVTLVVP